MKGERMAKRSSFGNIMRKRLSDITNTQAQHKLVGLMVEQSQISESNEDLINQLLQVCMTFSFYRSLNDVLCKY
jgi:hypothetical protein